MMVMTATMATMAMMNDTDDDDDDDDDGACDVASLPIALAICSSVMNPFEMSPPSSRNPKQSLNPKLMTKNINETSTQKVPQTPVLHPKP